MPGYLEDRDRELSQIARVAGDAARIIGGLTHYSTTQMERLERHHADCVRASEHVALIEKRLNADLRLVWRNQRLVDRVHRIAGNSVAFVRRVFKPRCRQVA